MPYRIIPFVNDQYYHIYNRGSEKRTIFESSRDYQRFLKTLTYYQIAGQKPKFSHFPSLSVPKLDESKKIIKVAAYCLMPNHFHLLLKQERDFGITQFMSKAINSYTRYYNTKHDRMGPLLQGMFKAVLIESGEQLVHVSRYIHINPTSSLLVKRPDQYQWSSYLEYIGKDKHKFCFTEDIMNNYKNPQDYQQFVLDQVGYGQDLEIIKHQLIDIEN